MRYVLALFLPWLVFFTMGMVGSAIICLILQLTLIGWLLWALYLWRRSGGRKHGTGVVGPRFYSVKVGAVDENTELDTVLDTDLDTEQERPSHD